MFSLLDFRFVGLIFNSAFFGVLFIEVVLSGPALGFTGGGAAGAGPLRGPILLVRGLLPLARGPPHWHA